MQTAAMMEPKVDLRDISLGSPERESLTVLGPVLQGNQNSEEREENNRY